MWGYPMNEKKIPKKPIEEWVKVYRTEDTRRSYKTAVRKFLSYTYDANLTKRMSEASPRDIKEIKKETEKETEELARDYLKAERNYYRDLRDFVIWLRDEIEYAPTTQNCYLNGVKQFFIEYGVEVERRRWKRLSRMTEASRAITKDRAPTKEELKKILAHLPLRGRAMVLCLVSSGMRIGELLSLKEDQVHLDENPTRVELEAEQTKTKDARTTFFSVEATQSLEKWLEFKNSKRWGKQGVNTKHIERAKESGRLFPFTRSWASKIFKRALEKAGLAERDENTDRLLIHLHTLRKFFRTKMEANAMVPHQSVQAMLGHRSGLSQAYRRIPLDDLREDYLEGEPSVTIHETETTLKRKIEDVEEGLRKERKTTQALADSVVHLIQNGNKEAALKIAKEIKNINEGEELSIEVEDK